MIRRPNLRLLLGIDFLSDGELRTLEGVPPGEMEVHKTLRMGILWQCVRSEGLGRNGELGS